ncbi:MAG: S9 family peptidase, partial [Cyclobacteriaceae bacterium]|nr:S9 family peptidase [Cyclobacteriaceae bacterium]
MKTTFYRAAVALVLVMIIGSCTKQAEVAQPKRYTIRQFMDIVQINGGAFSPDESKVLISGKETGIFNAEEIDIKTGEKKPLTASTDNAVFALSYFPADERVVYTSDKGGNEINHIFVRNPDGSTIDLIPDSTAKAQFAGWSYSKKLMYYASNSRDKKYFDLYNVQVARGEKKVYPATLVYKNEKGLNPDVISNDDRYIALSENITTNNSNMYLLDTQSGKMQLLSKHEGDAQYNPQYFSLDGKKLYFLTDEGSEFMYLASYDIATGAKQKVEEGSTVQVEVTSTDGRRTTK